MEKFDITQAEKEMLACHASALCISFLEMVDDLGCDDRAVRLALTLIIEERKEWMKPKN